MSLNKKEKKIRKRIIIELLKTHVDKTENNKHNIYENIKSKKRTMLKQVLEHIPIILTFRLIFIIYLKL